MDLPLPIRILLLPLSWIYGLVVRCKAWLYSSGVLRRQRLHGAVVSVGNLTVGGTGKTPMVMWLAEKFLAEGKRIAILSRGYRGAQGTSDEIEILKLRLGGRVRFGVGPDRFEQGRKLEEAEPVDVFLLDDGFQHLKLTRDVDILLFDGSKGRYKDWLLPAGRMREPFGAWRRAHLVVLTRMKDGEKPGPWEAPLYCARTELLGFRKLGEHGAPSNRIETGKEPLFAFCGIGNPAAYFADLKRWNTTLVGTKEFSDHHRYSASDAVELESLATRAGAAALVTTEKDEQNLVGVEFPELPVYVAVIALSVSNQREFSAEIDRILAERRSQTR